MHMADALLSPIIGGGMWAISAIALGFSAKAAKRVVISSSSNYLDAETDADAGVDDSAGKILPLMSVLGAFVFAGQMLNFAIPGTGSSGHIGGGVLLAALLGPAPALMVISAVLLIQCLFFADGGLLAYGANVFNMGICAGILAHIAVYRPLLKNHFNARRLGVAAFAAAVVGLQIGAFAVCCETYFSGIAQLPFSTFLLAMLPIHLAIGAVEGVLTAMILQYVYRVRPDLLRRKNFTDSSAAASERADSFAIAGTFAPFVFAKKKSSRRLVWTFAVAALVLGGGFSYLASESPDGLEWSIARVAGAAEIPTGPAAKNAAAIIESTALMPDYQFASSANKFGTAAAGIFGGSVVALLIGTFGLAFRGHAKNCADDNRENN